MKNCFIIRPSKNIILASSLVLFLSFCKSSTAQRRVKDYLLTGSSMLVSGMLDGTIESINYHYDAGFKTRFPKINDQFWNPALSWKNKYKNGSSALGPKFTGSTNMFVCTTDAYHMLRMAKRSVDALTLVYYINKTYTENKPANNILEDGIPHSVKKRKKWKNAATDFLVLTAIRCIGFNITYSLAFNPNKNYLRN